MGNKLNITICEKQMNIPLIKKMVDALNNSGKPLYTEYPDSCDYSTNYWERKYDSFTIDKCSYRRKYINKMEQNELFGEESNDEFVVERKFSRHYIETKHHSIFGNELRDGDESMQKWIAEVDCITKTIICYNEFEFPLLKQIAEEFGFKSLVKCWEGAE